MRIWNIFSEIENRNLKKLAEIRTVQALRLLAYNSFIFIIFLVESENRKSRNFCHLMKDRVLDKGQQVL